METLQNNFTTPEQSKRLLELGLPADSADCYYDKFRILPNLLFNGDTFQDLLDAYEPEKQDEFLPCWSVGRLIEILEICQEYCFQFNGDYDKWIPYNHCTPEDLVKIYSDKRNKFDFSKLEE